MPLPVLSARLDCPPSLATVPPRLRACRFVVKMSKPVEAGDLVEVEVMISQATAPAGWSRPFPVGPLNLVIRVHQ